MLTVVHFVLFTIFVYRVFGVSRRIRSWRQRKSREQQARCSQSRPQQAPRPQVVGRDAPPPRAHVEGDEAILRAEAAGPETARERLAVLATDARFAAAVAANPSCPGAILDSLGSSWDTEALVTIVGHPNVLPHTLLKLGHLSPAAFFANPVSTLMLLDKPDLPLHCSPDMLLPLVRHADASPGFLSILSNHEVSLVADEARMHVNLGGEVAPERLDDELQRSLWQWQAPGLDGRSELIQAAEMRLIAPWIVAPLVLYGSDTLRRAIARNIERHCPTLALLHRAGARGDLAGYATPDPTLPPDLLDLLARTAPWGRCLAARHPATSPATLVRLAGDRAPEVRRLAARNPRLPATALASLAGDPHAVIRKEVGYNERTPRHALERLARDGQRHVRVAVATNRSSAPELVAALAGDTEWQVRRAVARHPASGAETLRTLAGDPHPLVRVEVAKRGEAVPECAVDIVGDPHPAVRAAALHHTALRADVRCEQEGRGGPAYNRFATRQAARQGATPSRRADGGARASVPATPAAVAEVLELLMESGWRDEAVRAVALAHPHVPAVRRDIQGRAGSWIERCAVARNPVSSDAVLGFLAHDTNRVVRAAARAACAARAAQALREGACA